MLHRILIDPAMCPGPPTIRGMRMTVSVIVKQVAGGMTTADMLEAYPELEQEDIVQTLRYVKKLSLFTQEPYHPSLRTHSLTGQDN